VLNPNATSPVSELLNRYLLIIMPTALRLRFSGSGYRITL
jgi:hypothetical protein